MKIHIFPLLIPGGEYVNKTSLNRRNMATLLSKKSGSVVVGPGSGVAGAGPSHRDWHEDEEFQEDISMEALDTDDTLTIGEIAAAKAAKIAAEKAEKIAAEKAEDNDEPFEDSGVVGPGSGVAGAALSPRDWHQEEEFLEDFNMEALNTDDTLTIGEIAAAKAAKIAAEIAEKAVEVTYSHSQTMSVKCQNQQVVSPQEPQVSNTNGFTFNNCNNITFVMKK
jgi:hypothetical protein